MELLAEDEIVSRLTFEPVPGSKIEYREISPEGFVRTRQIDVPDEPEQANNEEPERKSKIQELDENHLVLMSKMQEALAKGLAEYLKPRSEASADEVRDLAQAYQAICTNMPSSFLF